MLFLIESLNALLKGRAKILFVSEKAKQTPD